MFWPLTLFTGPTKWLHLTPEAQTSVIDQVHFAVWKDVWSHPHSMVDVADKVSKETLRLDRIICP